MKGINRLIFIFILIFPIFPIQAQKNTPFTFKKCLVNTINYEQGLSNNETHDIVTDYLGFTWVASNTGIQRYNGYELVNINPVIGKDTIKIKNLAQFLLLKNGKIWIIYKKGILEYDPYSDHFQNLFELKSPSIEDFPIIPLKETKEGIWCLQVNKGLILFSPLGKLIKVFPGDPKFYNSVFQFNHHEICSNKDFIFLHIPNKGLFEINISSHEIKSFKIMAEEIFDIACTDSFFFAYSSKGITRFQISNWKALNFHPNTTKFSQSLLFFCRLLTISPNRILACFNDELFEFDSTMNHQKIYVQSNGSPVILSGGIDRIYLDEFKRIWLLTNDDIKRIQDRDIPFEYLNYPKTRNNFIRSLYYDENEKQLLAGCFNGGIQLYDSLSNPIWNEPIINPEVKDILSINKLRDKKYLIITWIKGWYILNTKDKTLVKILDYKKTDPNYRISMNGFISNTQRINDSTFFIACLMNVYKCDFKKDKLFKINPVFIDKNYDKIYPTAIYYSKKGILWIGTYSGNVFKVNKDGKIDQISLPENYTTRSINEDRDGNIWIGTNTGLYVVNPEGIYLRRYHKDSGLLNDCIYAIQPLDTGYNVIVSSNMGLSQISIKGQVKNYTKEYGLQENEFNTNSSFKTISGRYYFGGINGINSFYQSSLNGLPSKSSLNITKLVVNDSIYNSSSGIWKGDNLELPYDKNHLQFDFACMGVLNIDKYLYEYRVLGFEKSWQSTHEPRSIRYILNAGNYLFQLRCLNSMTGQVIYKDWPIFIHLPWWLTWWFISGMILLVFILLFLIVSFLNKIKYEKKVEELNMKKALQNERERISRDLHDNLGSQANAIYYGTELLINNKSNDGDIISNLHTTSKNMLLVLRETLWAMKITHVESSDIWVRILNFTMNLKVYYPKIKIMPIGSPPPHISFDANRSLNIVLIIQEAVNNAVRHSGAGQIKIYNEIENSIWKIVVEDDGKGFDKELAKEKSDSYGLYNMYQRAKESNLEFELNSSEMGTSISLAMNIQ